MPDNIIIGTDKAFRGDNAYSYEKTQIGDETIYVCNKGSQWARQGEVLVLRRKTGIWTAFDGDIIDGGRHFSAVNQSSVALRRTLHSQDGITGKPITLPVPMTPALRSIGMALFGLKPGCHDAMMHHA